MPPKIGDKVSYQGREANVSNIMGTEPNQIFTLKFDDGTERVATANELGAANKPHVDNTLPSNQPNRPNQDLPKRGGFEQEGTGRFEGSGGSMQGKDRDTRYELPSAGKPEPTPFGDVPIVDPKPPSVGGEGDNTPNDQGAGTGDTGAGLKADGKDVDSPRRRLLGTEEIVTYIEPVTRRVVDRNGRTLEIGQTVSIKARIIGFKDRGRDEAGNKGGLKAEVIYPPYRIGSTIPIWSEERKRLEIPNQDDVNVAGGAPYEDGIFSYKDGKIVDANGNEPPKQELQKQEKLVIDVRHVERF
jgi:hypothetical protein